MIIQGSKERLVEDAARIISERIEVLLRKQRHVVIAVPGGRSVSGVFENLCKHHVPWRQLRVFLLDERLVPLDDSQSNYRLVSQHLPEDLPAGVLHPFLFDPENPGAGAAAYEENLQYCGGHFDIVLASSGEDGHIASLFPHHHSVEQKSPGFIIMDDAPKPPQGRMSAGPELIRKADTGVLLFLGAAKNNALKNLLNQHLSYLDCPAKIVTQLSRYYILTDQEVDAP
jgi:6-phosphogluconolactonase